MNNQNSALPQQQQFYAASHSQVQQALSYHQQQNDNRFPQNFTPIPNGAPPPFHHQLPMAHRQQLLPPQPSFNQPRNIGHGQNVYSTATAMGVAQFVGPNAANFAGNGTHHQQQFMQQPPLATTHFNPPIGGVCVGGFNPNQQQQNNPIIGAGPGIHLQPSYSQPSHLHLLHQQPTQQQMSMTHAQQPFQQALMFNTPNGGQQQLQQQFSAQFPQQQQQSMGQPNQLFGSTATMYQSTETLGIPPHQSQLMQQQHNFVGGIQQPAATILEQQTPPSATAVTSPFRFHQSNAPASRLDPQLELNKDLTKPQRKIWAQKQAEQQHQQNSMTPNGGGGDAQQQTLPPSTTPVSPALNANAIAPSGGMLATTVETTNSTPEKSLGIGAAPRNNVLEDEKFGVSTENDGSMLNTVGGGDGQATPQESAAVATNSTAVNANANAPPPSNYHSQAPNSQPQSRRQSQDVRYVYNSSTYQQQQGQGGRGDQSNWKGQQNRPSGQYNNYKSNMGGGQPHSYNNNASNPHQFHNQNNQSSFFGGRQSHDNRFAHPCMGCEGVGHRLLNCPKSKNEQDSLANIAGQFEKQTHHPAFQPPKEMSSSSNRQPYQQQHSQGGRSGGGDFHHQNAQSQQQNYHKRFGSGGGGGTGGGNRYNNNNYGRDGGGGGGGVRAPKSGGGGSGGYHRNAPHNPQQPQ